MSNIVIPERRLPLLIRVIGGKFRDGRHSYRMKWGELSFRPGLALSLDMFGEHFSLHVHLIFINAYMTLPFLQRWHREPDEIMDSWGFRTFEQAVHLRWGRHTKIVTMPWADWVHLSHEVRRPDGSWVPFVGSWKDEEPDGREVEIYPYRYLLSSGEKQDRTATIYVDRRTWALRWLRWCPWFKRVRHSINVDFNDEVGERTGSWKGGCIGCGYELRENETPLECLRRMERGRKF